MRCSLNEKVNIKIGGDFDPPRCIRVAFPGSGGVVSRDGLCLSVLHADCIARGSSPHTPTDPLPQRAPCGLHLGVTTNQQMLTELCLSVLHADCIRLFHQFQNVNIRLCLSVLHADCIAARSPPVRRSGSLPQRAPCGLHRRQRVCDDQAPALCLSVLHANCINTVHSDSVNTIFFASACSMRIASLRRKAALSARRSLPQRAPCGLHLADEGANGFTTHFASACSMRIASIQTGQVQIMHRLCLSVLHADCITTSPSWAICLRPFASACSMRIASVTAQYQTQHIHLCLSVLHADCIAA